MNKTFESDSEKQRASTTSTESASTSLSQNTDRSSSQLYYELSPGELQPDVTTLTTPNGEILTYIGPLKGRGQNTFGGFFQSARGDTVLIKADKPGVCLAEATATNEILPENQRQSINCATMGCIRIKNKPTLVTIQPMVTGNSDEMVKPFDEMVYKRKRNPNPFDIQDMSFKSDEARHEQEIIDFLKSDRMTPQAKEELAYALKARSELGDESVHLGQYMALVKDDIVVGIRAIDFGARERFSVARVSNVERSNKERLDPTKTSYYYQNQYVINPKGKNYIEYFLNEPALRQKYLETFEKTNPQQNAEIIVDHFSKQLDQIPDEKLQLQALKEFMETINAKSKNKIKLPSNGTTQDKIHYFLTKYHAVVLERIETMQTMAKHHLLGEKLMQEHDLSNKYASTSHESSSRSSTISSDRTSISSITSSTSNSTDSSFSTRQSNASFKARYKEGNPPTSEKPSERNSPVSDSFLKYHK